MSLHETFINNLPDVLYMNAYELSESHGNSPQEWKEYLKQPETKRLIEREIAEMAEAAARRAIRDLGDKPSSSDIQAAKQLLENSKLLQQKSQTQHTIVLTYLPPRGEEPSPPIEEKPIDQQLVSSQEEEPQQEEEEEKVVSSEEPEPEPKEESIHERLKKEEPLEYEDFESLF